MFRQLAEDEFFDVLEDSAWDLEVPDLDEQQTDLEGTSDEDQNGGVQKLSAAATIVKRFQGMATQKRTHHNTSVQDDINLLAKVGTLPKSSSTCTASSTHSVEASTFLIRGKHYLRDWTIRLISSPT